MRSCPKCQRLLADEVKFCTSDGTPLISVPIDPFLGSVVGDRYVLLEKVGEGNSGTIYRAEHVLLRNILAVKLLHQRFSQDETLVERFQKEAATVAKIDSEHIVRVSDFGRTNDGRLFFAMEFLEGETLSELLAREKKLTEEHALSLLKQIGETLGEAHELGVVHRDIKPRNIFITAKKKREVVKLLDFGLAKLTTSSNTSKTVKDGSNTLDPKYISPEQVSGDSVDNRTDIYALGLVAYEMVTGVPPFEGENASDLLKKHLEANFVPIREYVPHISISFANAVARALNKKSKDRFATIEQFLFALTNQTEYKESSFPAASSKTMLGHGLTSSQVIAAAGAIETHLEHSMEDKTAQPIEAIPKVETSEVFISENEDKEAMPIQDDIPTVTIAAEAALQAARQMEKEQQLKELKLEPADQDSSVPVYEQDVISGDGIHPTQSGNWFAEGVEAEQQLEKVKVGQNPLPAIYESLEEDGDGEAAKGGAGTKILAAVIVFAAICVCVLYFVLRDGTSSKKTQIAFRTEIPEDSAAKKDSGNFEIAEKQIDQGIKTDINISSGIKVDAQKPKEVVLKISPQDSKLKVPKVTDKKPQKIAKTIQKTAPKKQTKKTSVVKTTPAMKKTKVASSVQTGTDNKAKAKIHVTSGQSELKKGSYSKAKIEFESALAIDSRNAWAYGGLGEVAFEMGNYNEAAKQLTKAVKLNPKLVRFLVMLGNVYFKQGKTEAAVKNFRRVLNLDGDNAEARQGLQAAIRKMASGS